MIELRNATSQTLQPGQALTFNGDVTKTGCDVCFNRQIPTSAKLKNSCALYKLEFSGNVASPTAGAATQLAIAVNGTPLVETAMNSTPSTANVLNNVGTGTYYRPGCADLNRISVINAGTVPVTVAQNSNLRISRRG